MAFTVGQAKDDLAAMLHGTTLNKIQSVNALGDRAARQLLHDLDPAETKRIANVANALYDDVNLYTTPSDLKGNKIIDIRPQVLRTNRDNFTHTANEIWDIQKANNTFTIEYRDTVKFFRIAKQLTAGLLLEDLNGITTNGTWAVGADATNLTEDSLNFLTGGVSLRFDLTGAAVASTGFLENSTFQAVDLSEHEDLSAIFLGP